MAIMEQINEQWRPIEGYEGLYEVSNMGRVKSLERIDRHNHLIKEKIRRPVMNTWKYLQVGLYKEGKKKIFQVHRLVAQAFLPNPEGLPQINHKDEDKTNNVVFLKDDGSVDECRSNLEWCDNKYNMNYGTRIERVVQTMIRKGIYDPELCGIGDRKERNRLRMRKYRLNNREKRNEYQREWYQGNLEKMREYQREYRRRKKTAKR